METLVVASQHRNQYCGPVKSRGGPVRFGSSPLALRDYGGMNCCSFQSAAGLLPSPFKSNLSPVSKRACSSSPKMPSPSVSLVSDSKNFSRTLARSAPIAIGSRVSTRNQYFGEDFSFSELWAGPAYSNSPPPSSLPIPKFSVRPPPKRTASLELARSAPDIMVHHPIARSAPVSPTREHGFYTRDIFHSADSATETLRRILNLDVSDE